MGIYRTIESRVRGARDYQRLDPIKRSLTAALRRACCGVEPGHWLDVGAGSGVHRELLGELATRYIGLDPRPRGKDVISGVGESLPFPAETFDAVLLSEVLEHVPDPQAVLAEVRRVLRIDGTLLVTVPFLFYEHEAPHDYQRFTKYGLREQLHCAGFEVEELQPTCGSVAVLGLFASVAFLGTLGKVPGLWEASLVWNRFWIDAIILPLDRVVDPQKRAAMGHYARARRRS